jgi:hypothetical protein
MGVALLAYFGSKSRRPDGPSIGLIGGALGGIVAGRAVAGLVTSLARKCEYQDVTEGDAIEKGTLTDELIATESKRKGLRSDIDLVERLIQAESGRDEEVTRKLLDYRAKLEHDLEL